MTGKDNDPSVSPGNEKTTEATEATYVPDDADRWRRRAEYEHRARNELGRAIDDIAVALGLSVMTPADAVVREVQRRAAIDMQGQPLTIEVARRAANADPDQYPVVAIDTDGRPVTALYPEPRSMKSTEPPPFIQEENRQFNALIEEMREYERVRAGFERPSIRKVEMRNAWWSGLVSVSLALENVGAPVKMPVAESVAVPRHGFLSCWRLWTDAVEGDDAVYLSAFGPPLFEATLTADRPSAYYRHHTVEGREAAQASGPPAVLLSRDARLVECDRPTWELDFAETHPDIRPGGRTRVFVMAPGPNHKGWSVAVVTGAPGEDHMPCLTLRPMVR